MSAPAAQTTQLRCHHCTHWLGETSEPAEFVGMFKQARDRANVPEPRDTYRCGACGWVNIFRREARSSGRDWRRVELKTSTVVAEIVKGP